eukprot:34036_1
MTKRPRIVEGNISGDKSSLTLGRQECPDAESHIKSLLETTTRCVDEVENDFGNLSKETSESCEQTISKLPSCLQKSRVPHARSHKKFETLPADIIGQILSFLDFSVQFLLKGVSKATGYKDDRSKLPQSRTYPLRYGTMQVHHRQPSQSQGNHH